MIEATLVEPGVPAGTMPASVLVWRSPAIARRQCLARRYELSEEVSAFLRAKYLGSQDAGRTTAAAARPFGGLLSGGSSGSPARERPRRSAATPPRVLTGAKLVVLAATLFVFAALAFVGEAQAGTVFAQGGFFTGEQEDQFSFNTPSAGTLSVTLSDLDSELNSKLGLPSNTFSPLSSLTLTLWSSTGELGSCSLATACKGVTIAGAGTYYGEIDAQAGSNALFPGLDIAIDQVIGDFAAVPLPASLWLVLSGLAATFWSARRRGGALVDSRVGHPKRASLPTGRLAV